MLCAVLYYAVFTLQLPADAVNLLRKMLELNPAKRIRAIDALFVSNASPHLICCGTPPGLSLQQPATAVAGKHSCL
jgi:hypothetical protein